MKKNNIILLVILGIIILILSIVLIYNKFGESANNTLRDFAVSDTASINKIFLVDMNKEHVLLERSDSGWVLNEQYKAREDFVTVLLETIKRLEIKSPVADKKLPKIMKDISAIGTKVQIYQKNKLVKTYYIGTDDSSNLGTYMILENSSRPFIMHLPGFTGFLSIRYTTSLSEWREHLIFNYDLHNIKKVKVSYSDSTNNSFSVEKINHTYNLYDHSGRNVNFEPDTLRMKALFNQIKLIAFETFVDDNLVGHKLDSLKKLPVMTQYEVTDKNNQTKIIKTYKRQNEMQLLNNEGNLFDFDVDYLYGVINNDKELVLLQYYVIDPITLTINDFKK